MTGSRSHDTPKDAPQDIPKAAPGECIGLLGGSFNPAHAGHLHVSLWALDLLDLDRVWWLVTPQNPLKPTVGMASYSERRGGAEKAASDPRITVTGLERDLGTNYTIDTLKALWEIYPHTRFVWLMGADSLLEAHLWKSWRDLFRLVPIAVFNRQPYSSRALGAVAARRFARARVAAARCRYLSRMKPPAWVFLSIPSHPASATRIRARSKVFRQDA